jgi:hypothetical protein
LKKIERRKTALKAQSDDGLLINYIYEKIQPNEEAPDGKKLFESYLDGRAYYLYYKNEIVVEKAFVNGKEIEQEKEIKVPLTTSLIGSELGWNNPKEIRKKLDALLHVEDLPETVRISGKKARAVFFRPGPLVKLCKEFVLDFDEDKGLPPELKPKQATLDSGTGGTR